MNRLPLLAGLTVCLLAFLGPLPSKSRSQEAVPGEAPQRKFDSEAEKILRRAADFYQQLDSYTADMMVQINVEIQSMKQEMTMDYRLSLRRPNLFAMKLHSGMMGATLISDGEKLLVHMPMLGQYTETEAPKDFVDILSADDSTGMGMMSDTPLLNALLALQPYEALTEQLTKLTYHGRETVRDTECHHLRFTDFQSQWDLWIRSGDQPLIQQLSSDLSSMIEDQMEANAEAAGEMAEMMRDMQMKVVIRFEDWQVNPELADDVFAFSPPEGASKTDSFLAGMTGEEKHSLRGQPAPEFTLPRLSGKELKLADHLGKEVVILDFWATWCGPCVKALPELIAVANDFKDRSVVFYGVNLREDNETIRAFLKKRNLEFNVLLDENGEVGSLYGVEGIPQTVIIGKEGTVQTVHVGYRPGLKSRLSSELESVLAGESLASEPDGPVTVEAKGMELAWSVEGPFSGVAVDSGERRILAAGRDGKMTFFDREGQVTGTFQVDNSGSLLRAANLLGDEKKEFLAYASWGHALAAFDVEGNRLWEISQGQGIDDVQAADLNGDGLDEVIIGYNGSTGLHVFDNRGAPLWKYTSIGNVWHVDAGNVIGDAGIEVVTTSARGQVHLFDSNGAKLADWKAGGYANLVRVLNVPEGKHRMVVADRSGGPQVLVAFNAEGKPVRPVELAAGDAYIDSAMPAPDRPWLAVQMRDGRLLVVDGAEGRIIASTQSDAQRGQVGWIASDDKPPLLLVATGRALQGFRVVAK